MSNPYGPLVQFDRPDKAQSCTRAMPPRIWVSAKPATTTITIITSPSRAARREVGAGCGSGSGGRQGSGFRILYLLHNDH
jgi:hypothetical protein